MNYHEAMQNDDFDTICYRAMANRLPIAISLESRKIYVGLVFDGLEPGEGSHITILPFYSGYRNPENLKFTIASAYDVVMKLWEEDSEDLVNYLMAFPRAKIDSLHIFNDHLYDTVNSQYT